MERRWKSRRRLRRRSVDEEKVKRVWKEGQKKGDGRGKMVGRGGSICGGMTVKGLYF